MSYPATNVCPKEKRAEAQSCGDLAATFRSMEEKAMKKATAITCVFLDIGEVLLTGGWDHHARERAATN